MSEVTQLEAQQDANKANIAKRDMLIKLLGNREFKKLIMDEYLVKEAARLAATSGDPNLTRDQRESAIGMAQAAGHLKRWINVVLLMGDSAERQMAELDEAIAEARAEADANDIIGADGTDGE